MWSGINDIINRNSKRKCNHIQLQVNDKIVANPREVGNHFNGYFTSIAEQMVRKQKEGKKDAGDYLKK